MRKKEWRIYGRKADFNGLGEELGISPLTVRIMCNRDVRTGEEMYKYLHPDRKNLYDPLLMKDMKKAAEIVTEKISGHKKIRIMGDYDIDGVTSTAILMEGLGHLGADVDWYIPNRVTDGYGMNMRMVENAINDGVDTIITCDNGISASEEVAYAKENGLTVIVTDHHDVPESGVPEADAVVDPKQEDCAYPFSGICGAVVAWKLMLALYDAINKPSDIIWNMLDLAAIATVGDVMDLKDENRQIVKLGLTVLRETKRPGLNALIEACSLNKGSISSYHIGFVLGPTINAGGRIESADLAENLLLTTELNPETKRQAEYLRTLNDNRKLMTGKNEEEAIALVEQTMAEARVIVVYLPDCNEAIAGIVAGRLREHYYRPSIVLTDSAEPGVVKGSGRSIEGYHMFHELEAVSDLLLKFGGHPMAAGLSLKKENIDALREALNENCTLTEDQMTERLWVDIALPISAITADWIKGLDVLEPFGKGNEKPVFADRNIRVVRAYVLGKEKNVLKLVIEDENNYRMEAMLFHGKDDFITMFEEYYGSGLLEKLYRGLSEEENVTKMSFVYYPSINSYRGTDTIQLVIEDFHFH